MWLALSGWIEAGREGIRKSQANRRRSAWTGIHRAEPENCSALYHPDSFQAWMNTLSLERAHRPVRRRKGAREHNKHRRRPEGRRMVAWTESVRANGSPSGLQEPAVAGTEAKHERPCEAKQARKDSDQDDRSVADDLHRGRVLNGARGRIVESASAGALESAVQRDEKSRQRSQARQQYAGRERQSDDEPDHPSCALQDGEIVLRSYSGRKGQGEPAIFPM